MRLLSLSLISCSSNASKKRCAGQPSKSDWAHKSPTKRLTVGNLKSVSIMPSRADVLAPVVVVATVAVIVVLGFVIDASFMPPPQTTRHNRPAWAA
jgi:hypothetical protein